MTVRLTDEEARELIARNAAAMLREEGVGGILGDDFNKYKDSAAARKRLERATEWVARQVEESL